MIRSMTGFGQSGCTSQGYRIQVDIKSVNHRYLETVVRLPKEWLAWEDGARRTVQAHVKRGRIDVFVSVEREAAGGRKAEIDWALADAYRLAAEQLRDRYSLSGPLSLEHLLGVPDLIGFRERDDREELAAELEAFLGECLREAMARLVSMRETEGGHLARDLSFRLDALERMQEAARRMAPAAVAEYRTKLRARLSELLKDREAGAIDEQRLAMEVALMAERSDIEEELTRLRSHIAQCRQLLQEDEPLGRKLDFLIQEMNREVNTIGSKGNHLDLIGQVVDMKAELEKMREQVQNIE